MHDNVEFDLSPGLALPAIRKRTTLEYNTPIFGLNTLWHLSDRWSLRLSGFYGGFGVDDVDGTYQAIGTVAYHFKACDQRARVFAGYRHLHINYDNGDVAFQLNATGPLLGLGFDF